MFGYFIFTRFETRRVSILFLVVPKNRVYVCLFVFSYRVMLDVVLIFAQLCL